MVCLQLHHLLEDHPRIRGKDYCVACPAPPNRITPAYAGKTAVTTRCIMRTQDHPRIRGKDPFLLPMPQCRKGITPAYAGKTSHSSQDCEKKRITPAYAGKTTRIRSLLHRRGITPAYAGKTNTQL